MAQERRSERRYCRVSSVPLSLHVHPSGNGGDSREVMRMGSKETLIQTDCPTADLLLHLPGNQNPSRKRAKVLYNGDGSGCGFCTTVRTQCGNRASIGCIPV